MIGREKQHFAFKQAGPVMEVLHTPFEEIGEHVIKPVYNATAPFIERLGRKVGWLPQKRRPDAPKEEIARTSGEASNPGPTSQGTLRKRLVALAKAARQSAKRSRSAGRPVQMNKARQAEPKPARKVKRELPAVKARSKMQFKNSSLAQERITVRCEELIGPVVPVNATYQNLLSMPISPGNANLMPGGIAYADLYEEFTVKRITFKYHHSAGTGTQGDVYMMIDTDVSDADPASAQQLYQNKLKVRFAPYDDASLTATIKDWTYKKSFIVEATSVSGVAAQDRQNYPGKFILACDHVEAASLNSAIGTLSVSYDLELHKRRPAQAVSFFGGGITGNYTMSNGSVNIRAATVPWDMSTVIHRGMPFSEVYGGNDINTGPNITQPPSLHKFIAVGSSSTWRVAGQVVITGNTFTGTTLLQLVGYNAANPTYYSLYPLATISAGFTGTIPYNNSVTVGSTSVTCIQLAFTNANASGGSLSVSSISLKLTPRYGETGPELAVHDTPTVFAIPQNENEAISYMAASPAGTTVTVYRPNKESTTKTLPSTLEEMRKLVRECMREDEDGHTGGPGVLVPASRNGLKGPR